MGELIPNEFEIVNVGRFSSQHCMRGVSGGEHCFIKCAIVNFRSSFVKNLVKKKGYYDEYKSTI